MLMKKVLLPILAAGVCASASALSLNDLTNKTVAVMLTGNGFQLSLPVATSSGVFQKTSDSKTLRLSNFYEGFGSNFQLQGDKLVFKTYTGDNKSPFYTDTYAVFSMCEVGMYTATLESGSTIPVMCWEYGSEDESWVANQYAGDPSGVQGWAFSTDGRALLLELMDVSQGTSNATLVDIQCFNSMQIYTYPTNATATEYQGNLIGDMYNVDVTVEDGKIAIKNFLNLGMSYQVNTSEPSYSLNFIQGTIDEDGIIELPIQEVAGDVDFSFTGQMDDNDSYLGDGQLFTNGPTGYWFVYMGTTYYPWQLVDYSSFNKTTGEASAVTGAMTTGEATHTGTNNWVGNGGDCKTQVETTYEFGPTGIYGAAYDDIIGSADRIVIKSSDESTADVELHIAKATYYDNTAQAIGFITSKANTDLVDHYDVYAVSGKYTSITDSGFVTDNTIGNANAVLVHDGSADTEKDYTFTDAFNHSGNGDYTFFVKANYTTASGLAPTFHAMTTVEAQNSAADIDANAAASVTAHNGVITIAGSDAEATVCNAAGAVIYKGYDRSIAVQPGVYMVQLGSTVVKVIL